MRMKRQSAVTLLAFGAVGCLARMGFQVLDRPEVSTISRAGGRSLFEESGVGHSTAPAESSRPPESKRATPTESEPGIPGPAVAGKTGRVDAPEPLPQDWGHPSERAVYARFDRVQDFASVYGPVPVRPLGKSRKEYETAVREGAPLIAEDQTALARRCAEVNRRTSNTMGNEAFQVFAFRDADAIEVIPGSSSLLARGAIGTVAKVLYSLAIRAATEDQRARIRLPKDKMPPSILALADELQTRNELAYRELWGALEAEVTRRADAGLFERNLAAVWVDPFGKVWLLRAGRDAQLDTLVQDYELRRRELRDRLVRLLSG